MARRLRYIPEGGAMVEVTCRTIHGRFLLRPSPRLNRIIAGLLARARRFYPVDIHGFVFLSNHFHLLMTVPNAQRLARFMGYFSGNLAREAGRLANWRDKFWARRYQAIVVSNEDAAQIARLRYILAHGVKEGLVPSVLDWPGLHSAGPLLAGTPVEGVWIDRTRLFRARSGERALATDEFESVEKLDLAPLPCWSHLTRSAYRKQVAALIAEIESDGKLLQPAAGSAEVESRDRIRARRTKRSPAPQFHCASRAAYRALIEAYRWFVACYREAVARFRTGDPVPEFPEGSFLPPVAVAQCAGL
jgi:REP element-mobilizing transposase RayT